MYDEAQMCYFYLEAYNLLLTGDRSDMTMTSTVNDAVGKEVLKRERQKKRVGESSVLVDQFAAGRLKSGTYSLTVSLRDTAKHELAEVSRKFYVFNPTLGVDSTLLSLGSALPLAVYSTMEEPELDRDFKWSRYEMSDPELSQYRQLKGADVKRKFLSDVWRHRPRGPGSCTWRASHMSTRISACSGARRVQDGQGKSLHRVRPPGRHRAPPQRIGHETVRDLDVQQHPGGGEFDFLQKVQGSDYELVNSTVRSELHDDNWMQQAQQAN